MTNLLVGGTVVAVAALSGLTSAVLHKYYVDSDGCNGHHWGDTKSVTDVTSATLDTAGFDKANPSVYRIEQEHGWIKLYEYGVQRCEDCGEIEQTTMMRGQISVDELIEELQDQ